MPGVRNGTNNLVPGDKVYKNYLVPNEIYEKNNLAVKGLMVKTCISSQHMQRPCACAHTYL